GGAITAPPPPPDPPLRLAARHLQSLASRMHVPWEVLRRSRSPAAVLEWDPILPRWCRRRRCRRRQ
ncbi:hypothetical protein ABPG77_009579, partial [Micractinium sp. CCAP 211/92]